MSNLELGQPADIIGCSYLWDLMQIDYASKNNASLYFDECSYSFADCFIIVFQMPKSYSQLVPNTLYHEKSNVDLFQWREKILFVWIILDYLIHRGRTY